MNTSRTYLTDLPNSSIDSEPSNQTRLVVTIAGTQDETPSWNASRVLFDPTQPQQIVVNYTLPGATTPETVTLAASAGCPAQVKIVYEGYQLSFSATFTPTAPGFASLAAHAALTHQTGLTAG